MQVRRDEIELRSCRDRVEVACSCRMTASTSWSSCLASMRIVSTASASSAWPHTSATAAACFLMIAESCFWNSHSRLCASRSRARCSSFLASESNAPTSFSAALIFSCSWSLRFCRCFSRVIWLCTCGNEREEQSTAARAKAAPPPRPHPFSVPVRRPWLLSRSAASCAPSQDERAGCRSGRVGAACRDVDNP
eukprot:6213372-Pleurochrysis_carterae.AAC.3